MAIGIDTSFLVASELADHPGHQAAKDLILNEVSKKKAFALCPQVLAEFLHVITDPKRFTNPVSMPGALQRADSIWNAREIRKVYPTNDATALFLYWMRTFRLGRKRILDTQLAALYYSTGIEEIATTDFRDFKIYEVFTIHPV